MVAVKINSLKQKLRAYKIVSHRQQYENTANFLS